MFAPPLGRASTNPATRIPDAFGQFGTPFYINPNIGRGRGRGGPIKTFFPLPEQTPPAEKPSPATGDEMEDAEEPPERVASYAPPREKYVNTGSKSVPHRERTPTGAPDEIPSDNLPKTYWKPSTDNALALIAKVPNMRSNLLAWVLAKTEILYLTHAEDPPWADELNLPEPFRHPLTKQLVKKKFIVCFLLASFGIPEECHQKKQSFIAPILPREFSRDSFLPLPKDRDYSLIDEYDRAWACLRALTYSAMVMENNCRSYPPMNKKEQEEVCQSVRDGAEPPGRSPSYIRRCKMLDEWKLYTYKESSLAKAYQIACRRYNVFPLAALAPFWDYSGEAIRPYLPLRPVCTRRTNPAASTRGH